MTIEPTDALIVVDIQNDFCPWGALGVKGGDEIVAPANRLADRFKHCVYTRDWHPENHCSFNETPEFMDGSWPVHCVQDTPGAEFHPYLHVMDDSWIVSKATEPDKEAYSAFDGTSLEEQLRAKAISRIFICGLATDYCVRATALDGLQLGLEVVVILNACRGVDVPPGSVAQAISEMREAGVVFCSTEELLCR